ncbi:6-phosphogluconolactonase [Xaviernesmea oryzae]|uniref:6-phosphogluconolactonase n=1 Tax=Xaviernesmea oryzae TaxID=464029 RepID=A0A1Q9ASG7_9HYPH|nr:6-phosphogluconolactonase [Xaviernesmea oryzae]OLP58367.1 6-phosphogluconolactonase [Xaviernesmea oryzae]SEL81261.1 6-phosphogluconolactonase [Xaviernesmea oryzae]
MSTTFNAFASGAELAEALAERVAAALSAGITARGGASLAVSGGSTPKAFFATLSKHDIDWPKVTVTLVDERFVSPDSDRSNHRLVAENLLQNNAAAAHFVPLYHPAEDVEIAAAEASIETAAIGQPFDVAILGMGGDGHTASFFPGGSRLSEALSPDTPRGVITMTAEGAGEPRLTFTFSALSDARLLVLHIEGDSKKAVLEKAQAEGDETDMPIRAVLRRAASPVEIYWAP